MVIDQVKENLLQKELNDLFTKKIPNPLLKNLYLLTINHKTAPVAIREKFAISDCTVSEAICELKKYKSLTSFLILSTCSRTELYFTTSDHKKAISDIYKYFATYKSVEEKITKEYSLVLTGDDVVTHAFKVACGLNSMVLGENQIFTQLRSAYATSQKEKTTGKILETLFQYVIQSAKEIHKNTDLSKKCRSISSASIELADKVSGPLREKAIMILGAGKMARLALEHIIKVGGSKETVVLNRSPHRIIEFPDKYQTDKSFPFEKIYEAMTEVDIVISATGAPHYIIFASEFQQIRKDSSKPLFILDISLPRNIDPGFRQLPNIQLMDIDNVQAIYTETSNTDNKDIEEANKIISRYTDNFYSQIEKQNIMPVIKELKEKFEKIRKEKISKIKNGKVVFTQEEVDYITKNIINTILHTPITNLKSSKLLGSQNEKLQLIKDLFEL